MPLKRVRKTLVVRPLEPCRALEREPSLEQIRPGDTSIDEFGVHVDELSNAIQAFFDQADMRLPLGIET